MSEEVVLESLIVEINSHWDRAKMASELEKSFPGSSLVEDSELAHKFQSSFIRQSEIVPCFSSVSTMRSSFESLRKILGVSLFYKFSDGKLIEWNQILFHPYAENLHPDLLPLKKGIYDKDFEHELFNWTRTDQKITLLFGDVEYLMLRILKNVQKMIANKRLRLFVSIEGDEAPTEIRFVRFDEQLSSSKDGIIKLKSKFSSTDENLSIQLSLDVEPRYKILKNAYVDFEEKLLVFHRLAGFFNSIEQKLIEEKLVESTHLSQNQIQIRSESMNVEVDSPDRALRFLKLLRDDLAPKFFLEVNFNHRFVQVETKDIRSNLYFSKDSKLSLSFGFALENKNFEIFNFPSTIADFAIGFERGFKAVFDKLDWPLSLKGIRRVRDTKLLKHIGIYNYFIFENLGRLIHGKCTDGLEREESEFKEMLYGNIAKYFLQGEGGVDADSFNALFSKSVLDHLEKFRELLKYSFTEDLRVLVDSKEIVFSEKIGSYLRLMYEMLNASTVASNGDCFIRSRTSFMPFEFQAEEDAVDQHYTTFGSEQMWELKVLTERNLGVVDKYPLFCKGLKRPYQISELFGLHKLGYHIYVDGVEVDLIDESQFKWQFSLLEKEAEDAMSLLGKQKMDWFELHPKFFLKGEEIDFEQARKLSQGEWIQFKGKYFILGDQAIPSVKLLEKFWQNIANKQVKTGMKDDSKPYFELDKNMSLELLALRTIGVEIEGGSEWKKITDFFDQMDSEEYAVDLDSSLKGVLKPYQVKGLSWVQGLYKLRLGGILADDMGLGKTLQALGFLDELREKNELGRALILVPTSLVYNWISECNKFTSKLKMESFNSKDKEGMTEKLNSEDNFVLVCTYGLFTEHEEFFQKFAWNVHIYDEAQNLKNILTKRTTAVRKLDARFKLCLTGTPLENHLGEFFSLLDLSVPGSLGSYEDFRKTYVNPNVINTDDIRYLRMKAKPLVLRRTKKEILTELPDKTISILKIPFSEEQKKIYRDVALSWNEKVKASILEVGEARSQMIMLTALLRLRQVCSDPGALPGVNYKETPPKIQLLTDTLASIVESGESAIVFTQFIHTLERISKNLKAMGVTVFTMDGRSSKAKREQCLQGFEHCEHGSILLMTLKTGGVGLNLTKASYVFHLEPWWNPAVEDQATDRVHRLGQKNAVQVYRYIMEESVEEKIELLKEKKASYFKSLFSMETEEDSATINSHGGLSKEDFEYLLS